MDFQGLVQKKSSVEGAVIHVDLPNGMGCRCTKSMVVVALMEVALDALLVHYDPLVVH